MKHHTPNLGSTTRKSSKSQSVSHQRNCKKTQIRFIINRERHIWELPMRFFEHMPIANTLLPLMRYLLSYPKHTKHWVGKDTSQTMRMSKYGWSSATATEMGMYNMNNTSTSLWDHWKDQASPFISDDIFSNTIMYDTIFEWINQAVILRAFASFKKLAPIASSLNWIRKRTGPTGTLSFIFTMNLTSTFFSELLMERDTVLSFTNMPEKAIHLLANLTYRYLSGEFSNDYIETVTLSITLSLFVPYLNLIALSLKWIWVWT